MTGKVTQALGTSLTRGMAITGAVAMMVTELFYELHSFTLELAAFGLTWFAIDSVRRLVQGDRRPVD